MKYALPLLLLPLSAFATDYMFANRDHPFHLETDGRIIGGADLEEKKYERSKAHYADATASVYYNQYLSPDTFLSYQAGYFFMRFDWDENPRFRGDNYQFGVASLAFVSTAIDNWRWVLKGAASVDAQSFNFGNTGVYYGLMWGRQAYTRNLGIHFGFFGWAGVKNIYVLPVLGMDWRMGEKWKLNLIFPLDFSLEYFFVPRWSLELAYTSFGGPYRSPKRAHGGVGRWDNGIFEVFSSGVELDLNYQYGQNFSAGIGGGWNLGGWILIKDHNDRHGKYYDFDTAPYAQGNLAFNF